MARFESKYLLDPATYWRVRHALQGWCGQDDHSRLAPDGRYLVRSLYFDTADYRAYVDKVSGVSQRNKLRIRTYAATREEAEFLVVEQKRRQGWLVEKLATRVTLAMYDRFLATGHWGHTGDPLLQDFERLVRLQHLRPVAVVSYHREAYFSRDGHRIRFSFDHDVSYCRAHDLFDPANRYRRDLGGRVVFEIKALRDDSPWVSDLVRRFGLHAEPNSKYVRAVEHTQHALHVRIAP